MRLRTTAMETKIRLQKRGLETLMVSMSIVALMPRMTMTQSYTTSQDHSTHTGGDATTTATRENTRSPAPPCLTSQYQCGNGACIPYSWLCDGIQDCCTGDDENLQFCSNLTSTVSTRTTTEAITSSTRSSTTGPSCSSSQFRCNNGQCIQSYWKCDGDLDCLTGEDESTQICRYCHGLLWACNNGSCIHSWRKCDGVRDCSEGEDENPAACATTTRSTTPSTITPTACTSSQFRCNNGRCISSSWKCDGDLDCPTGEDESQELCGTPCTSSQFRCNNGRCIRSSWKCDGDLDCPTGEDETQKLCGYCRGTLFPCINDSCIRASQKCDDVSDCSTGEDESNSTCFVACTSYQFRCNSRRCISYLWQCDGGRDCPGGEDESVAVCGYCRGSLFQCGNGSCISPDKLCDDIPDCSEGEDESATTCKGRCAGGLIRCPTDRSCISPYRLCDLINDCPDGFDEKNCTAGCLNTQFTCNDGKCIDLDWTCDGTKDCDSGEDEKLPTCRICSSSQFQCVSNKTICIDSMQHCDGTAQCPDASDEAKCLNIGADGPSSPGLVNQPVTVTYRGQQSYSICADDWTNDWSDNICKLIGYKERENTSTNLSIPSDGQLLKLNQYVSASDNFMLSINETRNCSSNASIGVSCKLQDCGRRAVSINSAGPYIINGQEAARGAWPWQVSLGLANSRPYESFCGGSLINNRWIVTAGHCVKDIWFASELVVKAGTLNVTKENDPEARLMNVDKFIKHPAYADVTLRNVVINDIALLRLSSPVTFTETIRPVCVAPENVDLNKFKVCVTTGWGTTKKGGDAASTLRQGKMKIRSTDECYQAFTTLFPGSYWAAARSDFNYFFCAGNIPASGGVDSCNGDSGGPFVCQDQQGGWTLMGATSFGFSNCGMSVFTRVSYFNSWINSQINLYS